MKQPPIKTLFRRLKALLLAAGVLWVVTVTAGSDTASGALKALRDAAPLNALRWELGDLGSRDDLSPAAVMAIGESPLLLSARTAVAELRKETETETTPAPDASE